MVMTLLLARSIHLVMYGFDNTSWLDTAWSIMELDGCPAKIVVMPANKSIEQFRHRFEGGVGCADFFFWLDAFRIAP